MKQEKSKECPKCGSTKHQEVVKIEPEDGDTSETFKCKSCGHEEHMFGEYDEKKERASIEKMGDAFREFLAKKKKH